MFQPQNDDENEVGKRTECRVSPSSGLMSCPTAPPTGFAIYFTIGIPSNSYRKKTGKRTNCNHHCSSGPPVKIEPCFRVFRTNDLVYRLCNRGEKLQVDPVH